MQQNHSNTKRKLNRETSQQSNFNYNFLQFMINEYSCDYSTPFTFIITCDNSKQQERKNNSQQKATH